MKKLTEALQTLVAKEQEPRVPINLPSVLDVGSLILSPEVDLFLQEQADYRSKTKAATFGSY